MTDRSDVVWGSRQLADQMANAEGPTGTPEQYRAARANQLLRRSNDLLLSASKSRTERLLLRKAIRQFLASESPVEPSGRGARARSANGTSGRRA